METKNGIRRLWMFAAMCLTSALATGQSELHTRTLVVNGQSGKAVVYRIDHEWFVDLETLARIANGSVVFHGDQIVLTVPQSGQTTAENHVVSATEGMSKDFMTAAIQDLSVIKTWYTTMAQAIQRGVPGDGSQMVVFHDRAAEGLRLASVHVSSRSDKDALLLLTNHFNQVDRWKTKLVDARRTMSTANYSITPESLKKDPDYQSIESCDHSLATIFSTGQYEHSDSCR
jgi:hypothetical protein